MIAKTPLELICTWNDVPEQIGVEYDIYLAKHGLDPLDYNIRWMDDMTRSTVVAEHRRCVENRNASLHPLHSNDLYGRCMCLVYRDRWRSIDYRYEDDD